MADLENMDGWTEEEIDAYFGTADDPIVSEPTIEQAEILDPWMGYDPATAGADDGGETA